MKLSRYLLPLLLVMMALPAAAQRKTRINLGTVVPQGSVWYEILQQMRQDWDRISGGRIELRIFAGGSMGDDAEMLRKVRIGQLQALAITSIGFSQIDDGVDALHAPMLFESYAELDYVREKMSAKLEKRIADKGFVVLNWTDGGWAQFFTKRPARTFDEIRKQTLWISAGDPKMEKLYIDYGFRVRALPLSEVLTQLQTGGIDAIDEPPLFAMLDGTYTKAPYMTDLKWAPVMGGTVISKQAWEQIPADIRPQLHQAARDAGQALRQRIRKLGDEAIPQMKERGLTVVEADRQAWLKEVEAAYPKLRGVLAPADLFDEAIRLRDEYRRKAGSQ